VIGKARKALTNTDTDCPLLHHAQIFHHHYQLLAVGVEERERREGGREGGEDGTQGDRNKRTHTCTRTRTGLEIFVW
jgi:hypothetical protein